MSVLPGPSKVLTDPAALLQAQLEGVDLWHVALRATVEAAGAPGLSRLARQDALRRLDLRRREQRVLVARAEAAGRQRSEPDADEQRRW